MPDQFTRQYFETKMQWAREEEPSYTQRLVPLQKVMTKEEGHSAHGGKNSIPQGRGPQKVQKQGHLAKSRGRIEDGGDQS